MPKWEDAVNTFLVLGTSRLPFFGKHFHKAFSHLLLSEAGAPRADSAKPIAKACLQPLDVSRSEAVTWLEWIPNWLASWAVCPWRLEEPPST
jgi:hypothetical protein